MPAVPAVPVPGGVVGPNLTPTVLRWGLVEFTKRATRLWLRRHEVDDRPSVRRELLDQLRCCLGRTEVVSRGEQATREVAQNPKA